MRDLAEGLRCAVVFAGEVLLMVLTLLGVAKAFVLVVFPVLFVVFLALLMVGSY
jgi:hypothetical protein